MSSPEAKIVHDIIHEQFAKDDDLPDLVEVKQKKRKYVPQFGKGEFCFFFLQYSNSTKNLKKSRKATLLTVLVYIFERISCNALYPCK